jgi:2-hydroxy-3-keto-5-methylthiopentenyl-1-phosphate phosphatase
MGAIVPVRVMRMGNRLVICDFDGTVTVQDTLEALSAQFAPRAHSTLEMALREGRVKLRDVLAAELGEMTHGAETIIQTAVERVPLREGFGELVRACTERGDRLVLLSAGFRQLIEPMLAAAGISNIPLLANDVVFSERGGSVSWRELPICHVCGEECKRWDVSQLRIDAAEVVYVGDGYSDRCGCLVADKIYARSELADWLDARGHSYTPFDDFHQIVTDLG